MRYYKPNHFKIYELVPPRVVEDRGEKGLELLDADLLRDLDTLRATLGRPMTVNNYYWGGRFQARGLRIPGMPDYKLYSMHSFGKAFDFDVQGMTAEEVRQHIIANRSRYPAIKAMEAGVNWCHVDSRNKLFAQDKIFLFDPHTGKGKAV
jgi:hypothetical protein